jgi:hypothetical protein
LCLCACVSPANRHGTLAPPLKIALAALGEHMVEQQLVMRWPGGERAMDAILEIAGGRLRLVMLAFGMRITSLEYDGKELAEQRFVPHAPDGARILNDLLLIAAPLEDLRRALPPGTSVSEARENGRMRREIVMDGATLAVIDYETESPWKGKVTFAHLAIGYELILESHEI